MISPKHKTRSVKKGPKHATNHAESGVSNAPPVVKDKVDSAPAVTLAPVPAAVSKVVPARVEVPVDEIADFDSFSEGPYEPEAAVEEPIVADSNARPKSASPAPKTPVEGDVLPVGVEAVTPPPERDEGEGVSSTARTNGGSDGMKAANPKSATPAKVPKKSREKTPPAASPDVPHAVRTENPTGAQSDGANEKTPAPSNREPMTAGSKDVPPETAPTTSTPRNDVGRGPAGPYTAMHIPPSPPVEPRTRALSRNDRPEPVVSVSAAQPAEVPQAAPQEAEAVPDSLTLARRYGYTITYPTPAPEGNRTEEVINRNHRVLADMCRNTFTPRTPTVYVAVKDILSRSINMLVSEYRVHEEISVLVDASRLTIWDVQRYVRPAEVLKLYDQLKVFECEQSVCFN